MTTSGAQGSPDARDAQRYFDSRFGQRYLRNADPIGQVAPGERFRVATVNGFGRRFRDEADFEALMCDPDKGALHHVCTGPILVEGTHIDCSIAVTIHAISIQSALHCISYSTGALRNDFAVRQCRLFPMGANTADIAGARVRSRPSVGVVATTDETPRSCGRCTANGGNLDIPLAGAGSCVVVPVNHVSAGLVIGDVHFRQGAGELAGVAVEADAELGLETQLREKIPYPLVETSEVIAVIGWGDTEPALCTATRNAVDYLQRLPFFSRRSQADLYQLVAGFDLMPGNLTGTVPTCAVLLPRREVSDPVSGRSVILPSRPRRMFRKPQERKEFDNVLEVCERRWDTLPLVHDGNSRQIRAVPGRADLVVARLKDAVHSHVQRGPVAAPGVGSLRAEINAVLSRALHLQGVRTSTLATRGNLVAMSRQTVADRIEVVVKSALIGSARHRYENITMQATRFGPPLGASFLHEPYVRFDWRTGTPGSDELIPRELADYFIDTQAAQATALKAFRALKDFLRACDLDVLDACFFMNVGGDVLCGEVSPDNMASIGYVGADPGLQVALGPVEKTQTCRRWRVIRDLVVAAEV